MNTQPKTKALTLALAVLLALALTAGWAVWAQTQFTDVPDDHPAKADIDLAVAQGWFKGYPDGTFKPDRPLTPDQLVTVVGRAFESGSTRAEFATFLRGGWQAMNSDADETAEAENDLDATIGAAGKP